VFVPYVVGLGGTTREGSSTEKAVSLALRATASQEADTCCSAEATSTCQPMSPGLRRIPRPVLLRPGLSRCDDNPVRKLRPENDMGFAG
jgi:hypothetical protein